jgi:formylglycine-generating enzyme required for sulfatase activity
MDVSSPDFRYPYDAADGRGNLHAPENVNRVPRGGAFWGIPRDVRCAARYWMLPDKRTHYYGFRVVVRPSS